VLPRRDSGPALAFWRARAAVATIFFLNGFGFANLVPRLAEAKSGLALGEAEFGLALLGFAGGALLAMPLSGGLCAHYGSRAITAIALFLFAPALILVALAPSLLALAGAFLAIGVTSGALDVAMNAQGVAVERRYPRPIMSSLHGMFSLGAMSGAISAGLLAAAGLELLPHLAAIAGSLIVAGLFACPALLPARFDASGAGPAFARPARGLLVLGVIAFCVLLAEGAVADWSAIYLRESLGAGTEMAAATFATFSVTMAAGRFAGDRLVARLGGDLIVRAGGALAASGLGLTLLIGHQNVAVAGFAMVGAGLSCVFPVMLSAAGRTPDLPPSAAIAAVCTVGYFGFLLGPPTIGGLAELIGLPGALCLVVFLCALVAALGSRAPRQHVQAPAPSSS
jgi:fucose permease